MLRAPERWWWLFPVQGDRWGLRGLGKKHRGLTELERWALEHPESHPRVGIIYQLLTARCHTSGRPRCKGSEGPRGSQAQGAHTRTLDCVASRSNILSQILLTLELSFPSSRNERVGCHGLLRPLWL